MVKGHLARPAWSSPAFVLAVVTFVVAMIALPLVVVGTAGAAKPKANPKPLATFTVNRSGATPLNTYSFKVPSGVKQVRFEVFGASGGHANGGKGGKTDASYNVSPGQVFQIVVGGAGGTPAGGLNGGGAGGGGAGGGGASDVRVCSDAAFKPCALTDRIVVAGGGGGGDGGGDFGCAGGAGGGLAGLSGSCFSAGGGGTQTTGGAAGGAGASAGTFGFGGTGAIQQFSFGSGGGGGWYGGGGGGNDESRFSEGGGGGGSGHISSPALSGTMTTGAWSGDGKATIYKG